MRIAQRMLLLSVILLFVIGFSFAQDTSGTSDTPRTGETTTQQTTDSTTQQTDQTQTTDTRQTTDSNTQQTDQTQTTDAQKTTDSTTQQTDQTEPTETEQTDSSGSGQTREQCPTLAEEPRCEEGQTLKLKYDEKGCIAGYECPVSTQGSCGNGICENGEESFCQADCIDAKPACPAQIICFDQTTVPCYQGENGGCKCDQCPIPEGRIPPGCVQETDEKGFVRVKCETNNRICQETPQDVRLKCVDGGGSPRFSKDPAGCEVFNCDFGKRGSLFSGQQQQQQCPTKEEIDSIFNKCGEVGVPGLIAFENGCQVARCAQQERRSCGQLTESEIKQKKESCNAGNELIRDFDRTGCPIFRCEHRDNQCPKDPPAEAFQRCSDDGGELIVRRDPNGCMAFAKCISRGDERNAYVERPTDVPDTTELLSIAFRLESLRIDLDKLAKKTEDIAKYYESTGSEDKERFNRVSDMFEAAVDKVDEIRGKLRDKVDGATIDDIVEIKQDIKYIKDVMLKDILYLMLSKEAVSKKSTSENDCGTDESCFGNALRVCKPITFYPEGDDGPKVTLKGLEGDSCIMYVVMEKFPGGQGPPGVQLPVDMTCKLKNYALGMRGSPEEEIFPYCEGKLIELIKQYGTEGPGGPGGCRGDECDEFCSKPENRETCQKWAEENGIDVRSTSGGRTDTRGQASRQDFNRGKGERDFERGYNEYDNYREPQYYNEGPQGEQFYDQGYGGDQYYGGGPQQYTDRPQYNTQPVSRPQPAACIGCFDNGICDANECPECVDCSRGLPPLEPVQETSAATIPETGSTNTETAASTEVTTETTV